MLAAARGMMGLSRTYSAPMEPGRDTLSVMLCFVLRLQVRKLFPDLPGDWWDCHRPHTRGWGGGKHLVSGHPIHLLTKRGDGDIRKVPSTWGQRRHPSSTPYNVFKSKLGQAGRLKEKRGRAGGLEGASSRPGLAWLERPPEVGAEWPFCPVEGAPAPNFLAPSPHGRPLHGLEREEVQQPGHPYSPPGPQKAVLEGHLGETRWGAKTQR